jgi:DNA-binding transcriptional ArsR family regulator
MQAALEAITEPRRRAILRLVRDDELPAGEIASEFEVTRQAVSQHLRVLREAGLVSERRDGVRRLYRARPEALSEVMGFLQEFWDASLDRLKSQVEDDERRSAGGRDR